VPGVVHHLPVRGYTHSGVQELRHLGRSVRKDAVHGGEVRPDLADQREAVLDGPGHGAFVGHDRPSPGLQAHLGDQSADTPRHPTEVEREFVREEGRLRRGLEDAPIAPRSERRPAPGVLVDGGVVAGLLLPEDEPHDVVGARGIEAILIHRRDHVVRWRRQYLEWASSFVIQEAGERADVRHAPFIATGRATERPYPGGQVRSHPGRETAVRTLAFG